VTGAGHGEELGETLYDSQDYRFQCCHRLTGLVG
jgi:hypothetical protein